MNGLGITASSGPPAKRSSSASKGKAVDVESEAIQGATTYIVGQDIQTKDAECRADLGVLFSQVSKIDAGQAVLISDQVNTASVLSQVSQFIAERGARQVHCIEFPSILLPSGCTQGSVVTIQCSRNVQEEQRRSDDFWNLQDDILAAFGNESPNPPSLRLRNVTQTSVTLEWDKLHLATAKLLSLTIWRNGQRLAAIPNPHNNTSTKVSGLDVDAPYSFHLIMRTTAGTFSSQTIKTRTLTLTDTSGIAVCFGAIEPPELLEEAKEALAHMRARHSHRIQIETTHFVCTHPSSEMPTASQDEPNPAVEYQRALQMSIPIVNPSWILSCLREKKMVPINLHYLDKNAASSTANLARSRSQASAAAKATPVVEETSAAPAASSKQTPIQLQQPPPPRNVVGESVEPKKEQRPVDQPEAQAEEPVIGAADQLERELGEQDAPPVVSEAAEEDKQTAKEDTEQAPEPSKENEEPVKEPEDKVKEEEPEQPAVEAEVKTPEEESKDEDEQKPGSKRGSMEEVSL